MRVQHIGLFPLTFPKASYDTTGRAISFRAAGQISPVRSAHVSFRTYNGTAEICLTGSQNGPFIELAPFESFDFPIETDALYIRGVGGPAEVAAVVAVNPIEQGARGR